MNLQLDNSLGDIVRAFNELAPADRDSQRSILMMLGFDLPSAERTMREVREEDTEEPAIHHLLDTIDKGLQDSRIEPESDKPRGRRPIPQEGAKAKGGPKPLKPLAYKEPTGFIGKLDKELVESPDDEKLLHELKHQPLFTPVWETGILVEILSAIVPLGPVDIEKLVEIVAGQRPIETIPHLPVRSLHGDIEILVDLGDGMEPFAGDQDVLVDRIKDTVGSDSVMVRKFVDCPMYGAGIGAVHKWEPYNAPKSGTVVLVVSNFGVPDTLAAHRLKQGWIEFFRLLEMSHCPVIGLTTYPGHRLPPGIAKRMITVQWDRGTTIGTVKSSRMKIERGTR